MSFILQFYNSLTFVRLDQVSNVDDVADYAMVVIAYVANGAMNTA